MLSPEEAFKFGFLGRCVEDGLSAEKTAEAAGRAAEYMQKAGLLQAGVDAVKALAGYAVPAAILAPPLAGAAAGYGLARATDIDDNDVDEVQNQEVIDEYDKQTKKLNRLKQVRDYARSIAKRPRPFM